MAEYIGRRIVPTHGGVWNETKEYEELVIVLDEESGDSYISRIPVPSGTALDDEEYWMLFSIYSEQIQEALDAIEETSEEMVAYVDKTAASLTEYVQDTATELTEQVEAAEDLTESNADTLNDRMDNLEARLDANVTASTDSDADYAAEVVDARVDDNSTTYDSLGANIRAIGKVRSLFNILPAWGWTSGKYVNDEGGLNSNSAWCAAVKIPVNGNAVLVNGEFGYLSSSEDYYNIACYDYNGNYLGGCFRAESNDVYDNQEVELLDNTAYISVSTTVAKKDKGQVYVCPDLRALKLLNNHGDWQWINGRVDIDWDDTNVTVSFPQLSYLCRKRSGTTYAQSKLDSSNDYSVEFERNTWWVVYYQSPSGYVEYADETISDEDADAEQIIFVESCTNSWGDLFTPDRFVFAVFYGDKVVYAAPSYGGTYIDGVDHGNLPARIEEVKDLITTRTSTVYLAYGAMELDTDANTIQITSQTLGVPDNGSHIWLQVNDEPVEINTPTEGRENYMRVLAYDASAGEVNLFETAEFRELGENGYYIAAWYQEKLWYPHINPSYTFVYNGTSYSAGELFYEENNNSFVEKRYADAISDAAASEAAGSNVMYLASGAFAMDIDTSTYEGTVQVTTRLLGVTEDMTFIWVSVNDEAVELNSPTANDVSSMRIFGFDASTKTLNLFSTSEFQALGSNGYYIASFWKGVFYNAHMNPDVKITYNGTEYSAGDIFDTDSASFVPTAYKEYVADYSAGDTDEDDLGDIVSPSHWDCMEGRQFSMFFDCLSRHEGRMNLYRLVNSMSLTRNEYCMNFTPDADDDDFTITIRRLNENTMETVETKTVTMKVHHPLTTSLTKNVCICGDSLVDNKYLAQEVWDMLDEDGDCVINHIGTRGGTGYEHEGRGSWKWATYLQGEDYSSKSNAFWDADNERLDFQKY